MLLEAARQLESMDSGLARETYLDAWNAAYYAGRFAPVGTLQAISRAARSAPRPTSGPRPSDLLLDGLALLVTEERTSAAPEPGQAARVFAQGNIPVAEGLRWGWAARVAANALWDEESWHDLLVRQLQSVREAGCSHICRSTSTRWQWPRLAAAISPPPVRCVAEAETIREATGSRLGRMGAVTLEGFRGRQSGSSRADRGRSEERVGCRAGPGDPMVPVGIGRAVQRSWPLPPGPGGRPTSQ